MSKYAELVTKLKAADKETIGLIAELLAILAEPDDNNNNNNNNNPKKSEKKETKLEEMTSKERAALILEGVAEKTQTTGVRITSGPWSQTSTIATTGTNANPYSAPAPAGQSITYGDSSSGSGLTMTSHASLLL